jgi:hypothetical protein
MHAQPHASNHNNFNPSGRHRSVNLVTDRSFSVARRQKPSPYDLAVRAGGTTRGKHGGCNRLAGQRVQRNQAAKSLFTNGVSRVRL